MLAFAVSVAALDTPGRSQQIADGAPADPAGGHHAVVGLAISDALGVPAHGDPFQRDLGLGAGRGMEFGRVEILQPYMIVFSLPSCRQPHSGPAGSNPQPVTSDDHGVCLGRAYTLARYADTRSCVSAVIFHSVARAIEARAWGRQSLMPPPSAVSWRAWRERTCPISPCRRAFRPCSASGHSAWS